MDRRFKRIAAGIVTLLALSLIFSSHALSDEVTIVGKINDNYQIVTDDGAIYEVEDTEMGEELLKHVGERVEVTGTMEKVEKDNVINVKSYQIINK